jgi:hypothetical protein
MQPNDLEYANLKKRIASYEIKGRSESASFLNWFLENVYRLDDVAADDAICDQPNDKGIDAIYLAPIIRGSWRLAMRAHDISRVDGGGCPGTLATRWRLELVGESGTCRIAYGPQAAIEVASAVKA